MCNYAAINNMNMCMEIASSSISVKLNGQLVHTLIKTELYTAKELLTLVL